jgi:hypothetical protein
VYVSLCGSDATGDGTILNPFLTIGFAMSQIVDAAAAKRYQIRIGPGTYAEAVVLKANVFLQGSAPVLTRISSLDVSDPSWTSAMDNRSGLQNIQVLGTTTLDFVAVQSQQGKVYIFESRLSGDVNFTACNSINELLLYNCELQGNLTHVGGDVLWYSSSIFGNVTVHDQDGNVVNPVVGQQVDTRFFGSGGGSLLPLNGSAGPSFTVQSVTTPSPPLSHTIQVQLTGFAVAGALTVVGAGVDVLGLTTVTASVTGVPSVALLSVSNSAVLNLLNYANGVGYVPSNLANWSGVQPVDVQNALDRVAAQLGPIV